MMDESILAVRAEELALALDRAEDCTDLRVAMQRFLMGVADLLFAGRTDQLAERVRNAITDSVSSLIENKMDGV